MSTDGTKTHFSLVVKSVQIEPATPQELTYAILNGDRFLPESSLDGGSQQKLTVIIKAATTAQQICNKLCYKLLALRDTIINCRLMDMMN